MTEVSRALTGASGNAEQVARAFCIRALAVNSGHRGRAMGLAAAWRGDFVERRALVTCHDRCRPAAAPAGAALASVPVPVITGSAAKSMTESGLETFTKDWAATGQSIL